MYLNYRHTEYLQNESRKYSFDPPPPQKKTNTQTKQKIKMMDIHTGIYVEEQIGIMIKTNIDTEVFLE